MRPIARDANFLASEENFANQPGHAQLFVPTDCLRQSMNSTVERPVFVQLNGWSGSISDGGAKVAERPRSFPKADEWRLRFHRGRVTPGKVQAFADQRMTDPPLPVQAATGLATLLSVLPAAADERGLIEDMMEHYLADLGATSPYPYLEQYWKEPGRHPYLLRHGNDLVGFALVRRFDNGSNYELVEFYVAARLRRQRFGGQAARALFNSHVGTWSVSVRRDNGVGQKFWASLLGHLASVTQHERQAPDGVVYKFTSPIGEV
jgi:predicted acetyltransferase